MKLVLRLIFAFGILAVGAGLMLEYSQPPAVVHAADPKATPSPTRCPDRPRCVCNSAGQIITCQIMAKPQ